MADQIPPPPPVPAAPLVGRDREMLVLRECLAAALAGRGGLVLIGGEAGIGKTTLAEAALAEAATQGALVLVGRCYDLAETPPHWPWADALARAPRGDGLPAPPDLTGAGAAASRAALFAAVRDHLAALAARRPLVLLLEDLHWADPASLDLLRAVARDLGEPPLLLLATYRADELARGHPLYALLPLLLREARAVRLDLRPLGAGGLRALVRGRYALPAPDEGRLVAYLLERAEGNPFFAGELLRALEEGDGLRRAEGGGWALGDLGDGAVPPLLRQVIDARVDRLGQAARDLLAVAAVLGQDVPADLWAAVARADEEALLAAIVAAAGAGLLAETADGVRFAHALTREAVYAGTPGLRRRAWHRHAAEVLLAAASPDPDAVAHHLQRAGDPRAADWLIQAGERARRADAVVTAVARFRAALALLDGPEHAALAGSLALQIGHLLRRADRRAAMQAFEEAIRRAREADDPVMAGIARCQLGYVHFLGDQFVRAIAELRTGVAALAAAPPEAWARTAAPHGGVTVASLTEARGLLAWVLATAGALDEALGLLGLPLDAADSALDTLGYYARLAVYQVACTRGRPGLARRAHERVREDVQAVEDARTLGGTLGGYFHRDVLIYRADDHAAIEEITGAAERAWARAQAAQLADPFPLSVLRFPLDFIGSAWDEAQTAIPIAQHWSSVLEQRGALMLGTIARLQGRPEEAWRQVRRWLPNGATTEPGGQKFLEGLACLHLGGHLLLDAGDLAAARRWAAASDRWLAWSGAVQGRAEGQALWAEYHRQAGDAARACRHAEQALAQASEPRQPLALLAAHRLVGELATAAGQHEAAAGHLDAALALADACGAPYERALTLLAVAELRLAGGEPDAAAPLAEARATFTALGAAPARARADALAARLAAAPVALPFGLTAREAEVLRLVAEGLTNAEAAARLFITPRTVNGHLTSIYTKLGVENRAAATRLAVERGLA